MDLSWSHCCVKIVEEMKGMRLIDDSVVSKIMSRGDGKATIVVCGGRLF